MKVAAPGQVPVVSRTGRIAEKLSDFGGLLRCTVCGTEQPLGDVGVRLENGWPKHCGYTMRWLTQRELDEEEAHA